MAGILLWSRLSHLTGWMLCPCAAPSRTGIECGQSRSGRCGTGLMRGLRWKSIGLVQNDCPSGLHGDETGLEPLGYQLFVIRDSLGEVHQVSSVVSGSSPVAQRKWMMFSWTGSGKSRKFLMADDGMMATDNIRIRQAVLCNININHYNL